MAGQEVTEGGRVRVKKRAASLGDDEGDGQTDRQRERAKTQADRVCVRVSWPRDERDQQDRAKQAVSEASLEV